jgi:hypothetical protein
MSASTDHSRGQQTLPDVIVSTRIRQFPKGIILRYETGNEELKEFLTGNSLLTYLMINFSDAYDLLQEHGALDEVVSNWQVPIVTATEDDSLLQDRQRDDLRYVLERVQPAIYIPDAGKVYGNNERDKQRGGLEEYRIRVDWLVEEIERNEWDIHLLPLAKAMEKWQIKEMRPWYRKHGFQNFAFYARQYYSDGNRFADLRRHTSHFVNLVEPDNILMIALHGKNHLEQLPPQVTGAAGLTQFIKHCDYDNESFKDWRTDLEATAFSTHNFWGA